MDARRCRGRRRNELTNSLLRGHIESWRGRLRVFIAIPEMDSNYRAISGAVNKPS